MNYRVAQRRSRRSSRTSKTTPSTSTPQPLEPEASADDKINLPVDLDSNDLGDATPPAKVSGKRKKQVKGKSKKAEEVIVEPEDHILVLMIPQATSDELQREKLTHASTYDEALVIIHETLGCADLKLKPALRFKLSSWTAKVPALNLGKVSDWDGCLDDVSAAEKHSKGKQPVSVTILVTEQYMLSLRTKLNLVKGAGKKKSKPVILDLEHAGSGDDDFDEGLGTMADEANKLEKLEKHLGNCQRCGPSKSCKITTSGQHHTLTNQQKAAWAKCLSLGGARVTYDTPPRNELFAMFFKSLDTASAVPASGNPPGPATIASGFGAIPPYMGINPYGFMPWGYPAPAAPFSQVPSTPGTPTPGSAPAHMSHASSTTLPPAFPSSDPPEAGSFNPYPEITDFLKRLDILEPRYGLHPESLLRKLIRYVDKFDELDLYTIDAIAALKTPEKIMEVAGLTFGNAKFLFAQVKREVRKVKEQIAA
ncbi:hypothetical protein GGX14DRAFT_394983 [Mycena pura]|uniref:Uncharacterized protein n=1 Tax=Mycena pura TaxID=153505 RepID=A0AAD6VI34_9AGAR|nr:hypothetical protein GGX14DRAFT_394983 [Mycena pura]